MTRTEQATQVARPRPRLVELDSLPATFSARAPKGERVLARSPSPIAPAPQAQDVAPRTAPLVAEAPEPTVSQTLVRYVRGAAAAPVASVAPKPRPPARRAPAASRPRSPRREAPASRPDVTEELVAVVGERLGLGVGGIAQSMYGKDTASGRARVTALLEGLGPRGREMALRLARMMLDRS